MYPVVDLGKEASLILGKKKIAEGRNAGRATSPSHLPFFSSATGYVCIVSLLHCICILCIRRHSVL